MNGLAEFKRPVAVSKRQENAEEGWPMMGSAQAGMAWHGICSGLQFRIFFCHRIFATTQNSLLG